VLTPIQGLPPNVVGVEANEKLTAEDYETILIPAVEAAESASTDGKVRMLFVFGQSFPGTTAGAAWEDTKLGLGNFRHWERTALVGDSDWLRHAVHALSWAMPGEVRVYSPSDLDDAMSWITS
jgi:hypothetical protein